jgi:3-oxosteroid 1-dehydrogenase
MAERRNWDKAADVVVVGSGSAALAAALAAAAGGARVIVLEKAAVLGGTTAMSGAGTWVPANHRMLAAGIADSKAEALTYLRATAPAGWAPTEDALWRAFVEAAPDMLAFLEAHTPLRFELVHHPDLYVEAPGGKFTGRMVSSRALPRGLAGPWRRRIRRPPKTHIFTYREFVVGTVLSRPSRRSSRWRRRFSTAWRPAASAWGTRSSSVSCAAASTRAARSWRRCGPSGW